MIQQPIKETCGNVTNQLADAPQVALDAAHILRPCRLAPLHLRCATPPHCVLAWQEICSQLSIAALKAGNGVCSALSAKAKSRPISLADVHGTVHSILHRLAVDVKDDIVRDVTQQLSVQSKSSHRRLLAATRTELVGLADFKKSLTDAIASAKAIFMKAIEGAVAEVAKQVAAALTQVQLY